MGRASPLQVRFGVLVSTRGWRGAHASTSHCHQCPCEENRIADLRRMKRSGRLRKWQHLRILIRERIFTPRPNIAATWLRFLPGGHWDAPLRELRVLALMKINRYQTSLNLQLSIRLGVSYE